MIPELFLCAALTMAPVFSGNHFPNEADAAFFRMFVHFRNHEYSDDYKKRNPIILLVDDGPVLVDYLRARLIPAYAMSRYASMSQWMFTGDIAQSPIADGSVWISVLINPLREVPELLALMRMTKPAGFLMADISLHPSIDRTLRNTRYERLPFNYHGYGIWRKSA